ncbi:hypothetical protein HQ560_14970 [bacterium]|nr:hypothetical protein [bacterium]
MAKQEQDFDIRVDEATGSVVSVMLYGEELLDSEAPLRSELHVNGEPLPLRPHTDPHDPTRELAHLKGEKFVNQLAGWGLVLARNIGGRQNTRFNCWGIEYLVRRELADQTCPCPGPGGPVVEAPLWVDTFGLLNWNWRFWGDDTRMIFPSSHSNGPSDEFGHCGYEHDTPENCKRFLQNVWRRQYPGVMAIHGGLFYNARTEHWIAITCRRPNVGYLLNIEDAGRGVGFDFTLHAPWNVDDSLHMPEIKLYYGRTRDEMMAWLGHYVTFYYEEPPDWVFRTMWGEGLAWNNQPTWAEQADYWEARFDSGELSGIGYCLVTNRPVHSGTTPLGYEPDPNHGTKDAFRRMCRRLADRGVPTLIWMSHSGLQPGGPDIDDDWFIRGIDGRMCRSWGSIDGGMAYVNTGHPGYIEYTKKWIRFYIGECGCKGIFLDCLGFASPPDFAPRPFMRFPGDTSRMFNVFMEEVHACIKACDPEAIMLGEGTPLDAPVDIFSIHANPVRAIDGMGPRDFFLHLNRWATKRLVIDQGPRFFPASGYCHMDERPGAEARNQALTKLLREHGGRDAFVPLVGDLSIHRELGLLVVPVTEAACPAIRLPEPWAGVTELVNDVEEGRFTRDGDGAFRGVPTGIYRMV